MANTEENKPEVSFDESGFSFKIGNLSSGKIAMIFAAVSTIVGALWGGFQVYQQFLTMKEVTAAYVPPDLSGINERISVLDERITSVERLTKGNSEALNYITGSVSSSITSTRQTVDALETRTRASDRDVLQSTRIILDRLQSQEVQQADRLREQEREQEMKIKSLEKQVDEKIQKTLANPLAGRE